MISEILSIFGIHKAGFLLTLASNVIRAFEQEFGENHDAKKAAINSLIDVLVQHRDAPVEKKEEVKE